MLLRARFRYALIATVFMLTITIIGPSAVAHNANTDRVTGLCHAGIESNHDPYISFIDASTYEYSTYSICHGVQVKVRYKINGIWRMAKDTDTTQPLFAHEAVGFDDLDYSDHNVWDESWRFVGWRRSH